MSFQPFSVNKYNPIKWIEPTDGILMQANAGFPVIDPIQSAYNGVPFDPVIAKLNKDINFFRDARDINEIFTIKTLEGKNKVDGEITLELPKPEQRQAIEQNAAENKDTSIAIVALAVILFALTRGK